ncbi:MAG: hypothetical protein ACO1OC_00905 [Tuberibacillus sp.]
MNNETVVMEPDEIIDADLLDLNEKDLPLLIQGQVSQLNELDKSVKKAIKAAGEAVDSATSARYKSAGFGKKKVAIEELQSAGMELAEAVQLGAEAQRISFEFQTKLAKISKYLFGLGVSNIASNRFVVRELELKLKGASEEELSDLARQELMSVVRQLKEQEDVLKKLENHSQTLKSHDGMLKKQAEKNKRLDEQLLAQAEIDRQHEKTIRRHEEELKAQVENDRRLSEKLQAQAKIISAHDEELKIQAETDKKLEEKCQSQAKMVKVHEDRLKQHAEAHKKLEDQLKNHSEVYKKLENKLETLGELNKTHNDKLNDHAKSISIQEDLLAAQSENIKNHDEQLAALKNYNNELKDVLKSHLTTIEAQAAKIQMLESQAKDMRNALESKASQTLLKMTLTTSILAIALSVIHFLI